LRKKHIWSLILMFLAFWLPSAGFGFDLQGHRGARGLAPENTLAAFEQALRLGVTTLELDIGVTADGVVVITHDPYLNPAITRDSSGQWLAASKGPLINSLSLAQLQSYDVGRINPASTYAGQFSSQQPKDGQTIPTLEAVFELVTALKAVEVRFNIETKLNPLQPLDTVSAEVMTRALLDAVRKAGMQNRITLQSFDWRTLQLARKIEPAIPTACLSSPGNLADPRWTAGLSLADHGSVPKLVVAAGCTIWSPNHSSLTQEQVTQAQQLGLKVLPWTVNTPADMQKLLDWQVDGLITDYPDRLRSLMRERGLPLPTPVDTQKR
jgi:glycerophosphoryl diester phosphodiesterase